MKMTRRPDYRVRRLGLVFTHKLRTNAANESQRDSGPKPKVARHELPWVNARMNFLNPNGVAASARPRQAQPRWGWTDFSPRTQGSSCLATLGCRTQSLWDCQQALSEMWVKTKSSRRTANAAPSSYPER